ncbi:MAG: site-2 protease family protein, partial [Candidatus Omnitrophica bacterium]|nr:site-2 protease family protein [Candidatus Omnitrophota bacterium]
MLQYRHTLLYKIIAVLISLAFLVNDVSFAADELRILTGRNAAAASCLAAPLGTKPFVYIDNAGGQLFIQPNPVATRLMQEAPVTMLCVTLATAQDKGLTREQSIALVKQLLDPADTHTVAGYNYAALSFDGDNIVIPSEKHDLIISHEPFDPVRHKEKIEYGDGQTRSLIQRPKTPGAWPQSSKPALTHGRAGLEPAPTVQPDTKKPAETPTPPEKKPDHADMTAINVVKTTAKVALAGGILIGLAVFAPKFAAGLFAFSIVYTVTVTVHDFGHAWLTDKFGDETPRRNGRLTLNPLRHMDLIETFLLPILAGFGMAKKLDIDDEDRLTDMHYRFVKAAGPAANILMAGVFGVTFLVAGGTGI